MIGDDFIQGIESKWMTDDDGKPFPQTTRDFWLLILSSPSCPT